MLEKTCGDNVASGSDVDLSSLNWERVIPQPFSKAQGCLCRDQVKDCTTEYCAIQYSSTRALEVASTGACGPQAPAGREAVEEGYPLPSARPREPKGQGLSTNLPLVGPHSAMVPLPGPPAPAPISRNLQSGKTPGPRNAVDEHPRPVSIAVYAERDPSVPRAGHTPDLRLNDAQLLPVCEHQPGWLGQVQVHLGPIAPPVGGALGAEVGDGQGDGPPRAGSVVHTTDLAQQQHVEEAK